MIEEEKVSGERDMLDDDLNYLKPRLMCSGQIRTAPPGIQLLKAEWDAAELRLLNDFEK